MMYRCLALSLLLCLALVSSTHGALIIGVNIANATVTEGSTGFVDVTIDSPSDLLQTFGIELRIAPLAATGLLEFVSPQPDPQLTDSDYVFFGDSKKLITASSVGSVSTTSTTNDTFVGSDETNSIANVLITTERLLLRLELDAAAALAGDTFKLSVELSSNTFFRTFTGNPGIPFEDILFAADPGTVTIAAAPVVNPIPEPSTLVMFVIGGAIATYSRRRRTKSVGA